MNSNRKTARIVGVLFLTALVTSILGGILIASILDAPDYLTNLYQNQTQVIIAVLLELICAAAVVGIAFMMFPIFKKHNEALALGYIGFRVIEAAIIVVGAITALLLITLSQEYLKAGAPDASYFQTLGALFMAARVHLAGLVLVIFFGLGALWFYYSLYQSKLIPRFISVWGLIGVALVLTLNFLEIFGHSVGMILALPILSNEIVLSTWLIVKGFNSSAIASGSAKTDINKV